MCIRNGESWSGVIARHTYSSNVLCLGTRPEIKGFQYSRSTVCFAASEWGFALGKHGLLSVKTIWSGPGVVMILIRNGSDPKYAGLLK